MSDKNKIKILLNEYGNFYLGKIRCETLLKALKTLAPDLVLQSDGMPGLPPQMQKVKTVKDRAEEVERDLKIISARFNATEEMLDAEPGGKEALKQWIWQPQQEQN